MTGKFGKLFTKIKTKNMRTLIFIFFFTSSFSYAQDNYFVLNIKGTVKKGNVILKKGDKLSSTDKITFYKSSVMLVNSDKFGLLPLTPNNKSTQSEVAYVLKDLFPQNKKASTRNNNTILNEIDLQNYFGNTKFRIYGNKSELHISPSYITLNDNSFLFFQYKYAFESNNVSKKISYIGQKIALIKDEIFKIDGKIVNPNDCVFIGLYLYKNGEDNLNELINFTPIFVDDSDLLIYANNLISVLDKNNIDIDSYNNLYNLLQDFIYSTFNTIEKDNLQFWIENKLGIKKP